MTTPVFPAADLAGDPASIKAGDHITLTGPTAHHIGVVRRLKPGTAIDLTDGEGLRLSCVITATAPGAVTLEVEETRHTAPYHPQLVLVQALTKGGRDEDAVEVATELGVRRIIPWAAARAIVRWNGAKATKGQAKWGNIAAAAVIQSRRSWGVEIAPVCDTTGLVAQVQAATAAGAAVLVLHEEASAGLAQPLATARANDTGEVWVIVGPEGGISPTEIEALTRAGASIVRLGPFVMRAGSAGPAALAVIAHQLGLWDTEH